MNTHDLIGGIVVAFDSTSGLGRVDADGRNFEFHCVEIADGSREIGVGAQVWFRPLRKLGQVEASEIRLRPV